VKGGIVTVLVGFFNRFMAPAVSGLGDLKPENSILVLSIVPIHIGPKYIAVQHMEAVCPASN
jgi:hypothetical protein